MPNYNISPIVNLETSSVYDASNINANNLVTRQYESKVTSTAIYATSSLAKQVDEVSKYYTITKVISPVLAVPQRPKVGQVYPN
jgi:hypothetical protein